MRYDNCATRVFCSSIAETRQFVFHVVPAPDHLAFYAELFDALTSLPDPAATPAQTAREPLQAVGTLAPSQKQVWSGAYRTAPYAHAVWPLVAICVVGVIITGCRRKGS
jgi:hypothetical protein